MLRLICCPGDLERFVCISFLTALVGMVVAGHDALYRLCIRSRSQNLFLRTSVQRNEACFKTGRVFVDGCFGSFVQPADLVVQLRI